MIVKTDNLSMESIDTGLPIPLYYQLKQILDKKIIIGIWKPGERIPTESELCRIFGVSRITVRQAIRELSNEGLVSAIAGKGTFISKPKLSEKHLQQNIGFYQEMTDRGLCVETSVLEQVVVPVPEDVRIQLRMDMGAKATKITRLRSLEGERLLIVLNYIPLDICPDLVDVELNNGSLYGVFKEKYGLEVEAGIRTIESVLASETDAQLLGIQESSPLLLIRGLSYLADKRPLEYFEAKHRGDRCKLEVEVVRFLV